MSSVGTKVGKTEKSDYVLEYVSDEALLLVRGDMSGKEEGRGSGIATLPGRFVSCWVDDYVIYRWL